MGLLDGAKRWMFARWVRKTKEEGMAGKLGTGVKTLWDLLDGWKTWLVALYLFSKELCTVDACTTAFGYGDAAMKAVGWDQVTGAFDSHQAVLAVLFLVAVIHRLVKAISQYRAGVPLVAIHSGK